MQTSSLVGSILRDRRLALGLRQSDVAVAAGISAPYLNLIEHNRRRVTADVLVRLAARLNIDPTYLSDGAGGGLAEDLRTAAALSGMQAELDRTEDFAGRFPGWAGVVVALHRRAEALDRTVAALNDRLNHDPYLSASLHEVLSAVSSVRSTAAILAETPDIDESWRARFLKNLHQDSERLAAGSEVLVAYLDGAAGGEAAVATPQDEVEAWLARRGWHLPELEGDAPPDLPEAEIAALASGAARDLARAWCLRAAADARALPLVPFRQALDQTGPDPALLAARFGVPMLTVFRRLATLPGSRIGLIVCDAAGALTLRKPADGFPVPRSGAACALWPLFTALSRPMSPVEAVVETAGRAGRRLLTRAICHAQPAGGFGAVELREAAMLILPEDQPGRAALPVGSTCRICPRAGCAARREVSILAGAV